MSLPPVSMTSQKSNSLPLTEEEKEDMKAIQEAIEYRIASVHPAKMEKFTEYLVRSMAS